MTRLAVAVVLVAIGAGSSGCAAPGVQPDLTTEPAAGTAGDAGPVESTEVTDVESCEAFVDVLTILQNANAGLHDGRMGQQEYDGWMRLATRVLDRVPERGEGPVSDAIVALKQAAPAIPAGAMGSTDLGTPKWANAAPLADLCSAAGYDLFAEGFTGG